MNIMNLMGKVKEVQAKLKEAQESISQIIAVGEAGAGMVKATVNGKKQVLKIEVDDELVKPEDKEIMCDLIVAAINKAMEEADTKTAQHLQQITGGIMPDLGGLDFSKFGM
ncbi:MAG: YbaB/EbfC family nucleoid-associated protein [Raineya sp.]